MPASRRSRRMRSTLNLYRLRDLGTSGRVPAAASARLATASDEEVTTTTSSLNGRRRGGTTSQSSAAKPIYIYPGLLRVLRHSAIALDSRCPAAVYRCAQCEAAGTAATRARCPHANACAICLDEFHGRDLVRRMPCSSAHVFHTRCILNWFKGNDKCPLCMDVVSAHPVKQSVRICEDAPRRLQPCQAAAAVAAAAAAAAATTTTTPPISAHHPRPPPSGQDPASMREFRRPPEVIGDTREFQSGPVLRRHKKGPRTYSYIVYDSVRMEVDQQQS